MTRTIPPTAQEHVLMGAALDQARLAAARGEVPVGAVLIDAHGVLLARAGNTRVAEHDPTAHAEINVIRVATAARGESMLQGCTLAVTLEPCVMCAGAILAARLDRVVFGAWDQKAGAVGSVYDLLRDARLPHPTPEVITGVRAEECAELLGAFFRTRRPMR